MTRRGSFVYYLAAVVVGCFLIALCFAAIGDRSLRFSTQGLRDFFLLYFLALVGGWASALVFGLLLRCVTKICRMRVMWQWTVSGAGLLPALLWSWSALWLRFLNARSLPGPALLWQSLFLGPVAATSLPSSWLAALASCIVAGGATALVLYKIHRAFQPPPGPAS